MRNRVILYAIDSDTGMVVSRVGDEYAWPILDFEGMRPENGFQTVYNLEKVKASSDTMYSIGRLLHTRKLPLKIKNLHREYWGMKPIKDAGKYCPKCGEYWKKDKCNKIGKDILSQDQKRQEAVGELLKI